jgi:hypothetical protein
VDFREICCESEIKHIKNAERTPTVNLSDKYILLVFLTISCVTSVLNKQQNRFP